MPKLTDEQLRDVVHGSLEASLRHDDEAVMLALQPLEDTGDDGDSYLFTVALIKVVALTLPPVVCPTHGPDSDCHPFAGIGVVAIDRATGQQLPFSEDEEIGSVTPEIEATYPDVIGYMRMLVAEINGDESTSVALWHAAVEKDYADRIMFRAIDSAADVIRAGRAALQ